MRVLLIDADSKIPNLALMKLSAYHKSIGDEVGFNIEEPDMIKASVVFEKNLKLLSGLKTLYPDIPIEIGGSGVDRLKKLPNEIEFIKPDYSLYPEIDHSMGFTTRGCIRNCHFCIVREKEGKLIRWQHPKEFHDDKFKTIMLMDNNWIADREWFFETSDWIIGNKLKLLEHGMDIRLIDDEIAEQLTKLKLGNNLKFAFDSDAIKDSVVKGIETLNRNGFNVRSKAVFYVYVDSEYDSGVERCRLLKKLGAVPFVMFNCRSTRTKRIKKLQHWANRKQLVCSCDIDDIL